MKVFVDCQCECGLPMWRGEKGTTAENIMQCTNINCQHLGVKYEVPTIQLRAVA